MQFINHLFLLVIFIIFYIDPKVLGNIHENFMYNLFLLIFLIIISIENKIIGAIGVIVYLYLLEYSKKEGMTQFQKEVEYDREELNKGFYKNSLSIFNNGKLTSREGFSVKISVDGIEKPNVKIPKINVNTSKYVPSVARIVFRDTRYLKNNFLGNAYKKYRKVKKIIS